MYHAVQNISYQWSHTSAASTKVLLCFPQNQTHDSSTCMHLGIGIYKTTEVPCFAKKFNSHVFSLASYTSRDPNYYFYTIVLPKNLCTFISHAVCSPLLSAQLLLFLHSPTSPTSTSLLSVPAFCIFLSLFQTTHGPTAQKTFLHSQRTPSSLPA